MQLLRNIWLTSCVRAEIIRENGSLSNVVSEGCRTIIWRVGVFKVPIRRSPEARLRLGRVYALLLRLPEKKAAGVKAAVPAEADAPAGL